MTTEIDKPEPRRRWYQFSLMQLLIAVLVLGSCLGLLAAKINRKRKERAVTAELLRLDGEVLYNWHGQRWRGTFRRDVEPQSGEPTGPTWLRWLLGDDFFSDVVYVALSPRQRIPVNSQGAWRYHPSRRDAAHAAKDDDLRLVATLPKLEELDLTDTDIGDIGLVHLQGLANLRTLALIYTNITDDGLRHLKSLTSLKRLYLDRTKTTEAGVDDLAKALPGCQISGP